MNIAHDQRELGKCQSDWSTVRQDWQTCKRGSMDQEE